MRYHRIGYIVFLAGFLSACKTSVVSTSSTDNYQEDLSGLRPDLSAVAKSPDNTPTTGSSSSNQYSSADLSITEELDSINKIIIQRNSEKKYVDGFTIQIYTGNDNEAAREAQEHSMLMFPDLEPVISYNQPTFKVKVGSYHNRLEAHKVFQSLKKEFPYALLIPERIAVNYE
ncbi:MAG: SPOR domain-containing protein [Cyclobacteriaceae bacterium]|nr:SPOR domain-containing protein [Cyclobacteriaceae bacterium SS2]